MERGGGREPDDEAWESRRRKQAEEIKRRGRVRARRRRLRRDAQRLARKKGKR